MHSYIQVAGGRTEYLSELRSGSEVVVADGASGRQRVALVGRVKVESRPLVRGGGYWGHDYNFRVALLFNSTEKFHAGSIKLSELMLSMDVHSYPYLWYVASSQLAFLGLNSHIQPGLG